GLWCVALALLPDNGCFRLSVARNAAGGKRNGAAIGRAPNPPLACPGRATAKPERRAGTQGYRNSERAGSRVSRSLSSGRASRGPVGSPGTRELLRVRLA